MHAEITNQIIAGLGTLRAKLPRDRRIALSIFSGVAVDPTMDPEILAILQAQYEPQLEPGAPGPTAKPQFGSVKNRTEVGTPSQRREQGAL
jgi:hypothetical protein